MKMLPFLTIRMKYTFGILLIIGSVFVISSCTEPRPSPPAGNEVTMGIFGGMGPEATADLYQQVLRLVPAEKDQEHIPTIIFSNPKVPDRMAAIRNGGEEILPYLEYSVKKLEASGASFIAIPCNTVHYFYDEMDKVVNIPIINMIKETALETQKLYPDKKKIGLLATSGTIESGLYTKELEKLGYEVIVPTDSIETHMVMKAVAGIKAKSRPETNEDLLAIAGQYLMDNGAEVIVLGCTEIPLAYNPARVDLPAINATQVLAKKSIEVYNSLNTN